MLEVRGLAATLAACAIFFAFSVEDASAQKISTASTARANAPQPLALTARGAWSPSVNYVTDDLVTLRNSAWRAKRPNINKLPGQTTPSTAADWELFAGGLNPFGAWTPLRTFQRNDLVLFQGSTFRALRTNLSKLPGQNVQDWQLFASKGAIGARGPRGLRGPQGPAGPNAVANGSVVAPAFSFASSPDTGIFLPAGGQIALAAGGQLFLHDKGNGNAALGLRALALNTGGQQNTALGHAAMYLNRVGSFNTAVGAAALGANTTGASNTAVGNQVLASNNSGRTNTAVGDRALSHISTGSNNIAIGYLAGGLANNSNDSIFIGNQSAPGDTLTIKIGTQGAQTTTFIAGIAGATVANSAAVLIDSTTGQLGTVASSRRYKENIEPMGAMGDMLAKLRPVTFRYRKPQADGSKPIQYGLIAEEVADVFPYLAVFNENGRPETVKYHLLPTFLLEGFQEQQKIIAAQAERIDELESRLAAIEAMLRSPMITAASARR